MPTTRNKKKRGRVMRGYYLGTVPISLRQRFKARCEELQWSESQGVRNALDEWCELSVARQREAPDLPDEESEQWYTACHPETRKALEDASGKIGISRNEAAVRAVFRWANASEG